MSDPVTGAVAELTAQGLPDGSVFTIADGNPATGTLTWTPVASQVGDVTIAFGAIDNQVPPLTAPPLTITIHVTPAPPPKVVKLTEGSISHWALVLRPVAARKAPDPSAKVVTVVPTATTDGTANLVSALEQQANSTGTWVRVRLAILPNNSTGWLPRSALGKWHTLHTRVYINRTLFMLVLARDGKTILRARIGVGKSYWPTPRGEFYVRDKLYGFPDTFYGPVAFGTSGRSAVLTDWPGGGYVGIHGTSIPQILPGQVSHGCVRLRNPDILRLAAMMPVGTPVTID